ncbi:hypothetical protein ABNF65_21315 [Paenibacillus larvae]
MNIKLPDRNQGDERKRTNRRGVVTAIDDVKTKGGRCFGISSKETCLLIERHPAQRWHELDLGSYMERENLSL